MKNEVRIIAGQWRGRPLKFPEVAGLRPTPSQVRETLFNWLQGWVAGARCLDLFAGSGALGFEAASRGASKVLQVESHRRILRALVANKRRLEAEQVEPVAADVLRFLKIPPRQPFDLAFLDPPFERNLIEPCTAALEQGGWLSPNARIYVEAEARLVEPLVPCNWRRLRHRVKGDVGYHLYQRT